MDFSPSLFLLLLHLLLNFTFSSSTLDILTQGSSLSVEKSTQDVLTSRNRVFSAGFYPVGENAFSFAIWIVKSSPPTIVWTANRDQPVNGVASKLTLSKNGNLVLKDGRRRIIWDTTKKSTFSRNDTKRSTVLKLRNDGNLVILDVFGFSVWESFGSPTDTLLTRQMLTKHVCLVSSRSKTNYSSGNYNLYFDNNNVLSLRYNVPETTTIYWPPSWNFLWKFGRSTYNNTRIAILDRLGNFTSSDDFSFTSTDYGTRILRRLTLDTDGNLRLYSLDEARMSWIVSWQAISQPCAVHGVCGPYGVCSYDRVLGRRGCDCLPGYRVKDRTDWTKGCEAEMEFTCNTSKVGFLEIKQTDFYGYDKSGFPNATFKDCEKTCLEMCSCKAFQFSFTTDNGYLCYPKTTLLNGYTSPTFHGRLYVKYPKKLLRSVRKGREKLRLVCPKEGSQVLNATYEKPKENGSLNFLLWFAISVAILETTCIVLVWFFLCRTDANANAKIAPDGYARAPMGFTKYTYAQLRAVTNGFRDEIGRGSGGVVYKATLPDRRIAAVKRLHEFSQEKDEFQDEASIIARLNHMNLIQLWGYCAERDHRLLVYEYIEHGSLADNLTCNTLNWEEMFNIAIGTAKGLAYLHEECLEWILHCDIKPQNILLDSDYEPKVADFGLCKLLNRGGANTLSFSRIRGTRGYMAPEWVYNLPISSKVDVYSYGIVVLEMVSGKNPNDVHNVENGKLFCWIKEIVETLMGNDECNLGQIERLVKVALKCVEEDKDLRPTMSQVVEMLQCND